DNARARPSGNEFNFDSEAGYDLNTNFARVEPFLGFSYDRLTIGSYTETGADPLNLTVSQQTASSLRSRLGSQISRSFPAGNTVLTPYLRLGWQHELANQSRAIEAQFAGQGGGTFQVKTADVARDGMLLGAGMNADLSR